jgi:hypothetical protein
MYLFHQGLERVVSLAEELGIMILVEPEPDLMIETTAQFKEFIKVSTSSATAGRCVRKRTFDFSLTLHSIILLLFFCFCGFFWTIVRS